MKTILTALLIIATSLGMAQTHKGKIKIITKNNGKTQVFNKSFTDVNEKEVRAWADSIAKEMHEGLKMKFDLDSESFSFSTDELERDLKDSILEKEIKIEMDCPQKSSCKKTIIINSVCKGDKHIKKEISHGKGNKKVFIDEERNINEEKTINNLTISPNPVVDKLKVSFEIAKKGDLNIEMVDEAGKVIMKENIPGFKGEYSKEIDLSKGKEGVYILKITQNGDTLVRKILKQ